MLVIYYEKGHLNKHSVDGPMILKFIIDDINKEWGTDYHLAKNNVDEKGILTIDQINNIRFHHEGKVDLAGEALPKNMSSVNLLQELDIYQALRQERSYKPSMPIKKALNISEEERETISSFLNETSKFFDVTQKLDYVAPFKEDDEKTKLFDKFANKFYKDLEPYLVVENDAKIANVEKYLKEIENAKANKTLRFDAFEDVKSHLER